jgi:hypothetical protein
MTRSCVVLIPIYKEELDSDEFFSVNSSLKHLKDFDIFFIGPEKIKLDYYAWHFPEIKFKGFDSEFFININGYNRLLTSDNFYLDFEDYDYMLILQPDAILLKNELSIWIDKDYDYIGAPWPMGFSLKITSNVIPVDDGILCTCFVGNGGLSLRKIKSCVKLINAFQDISTNWRDIGHAEDLYFSFLGTMLTDFKLPNFKTASEFSHDIDPVFLYKLNSNSIPFGCHAWKKYDAPHWIRIFNELKLGYKE